MAPGNVGGAALGNHVATRGFALFDTPIGRCAFAWSERGLTAVQLPQTDLARTPTPVLHRFADSIGLYGLSIATGWP